MTRKTKILITTGIYPPSIGGPASYSKLLMEKLGDRGFETSVVTFDSVRKFPKLISHIIFFFIVIIRGLKVDIIYAQDPVSVGFPAFLASKIIFKKFILKVVGDFAWEQGVSRFNVKDSLDDFVKNKQKNLYVRILQKIELFVAKGADRIIVPSRYLSNIVASWGIRSSKITVIYNAFNKPKINFKKKNNDEFFDIVTVGRLVPWKGFDLLIEITKDIIIDFPNTRLYIAGSGKDEDKLKKLSEGFEKNIFLLGGLPQEVLHEKIKQSDLFVLNTSYEGFSHQLLEVMALEVPIITTNVGGNVELIVNNQNGVLVEVNNRNDIKSAIIDLMKNAEKRKTLVQNAKKTIENFSEDRMLGELSKVLENTK